MSEKFSTEEEYNRYRSGVDGRPTNLTDESLSFVDGANHSLVQHTKRADTEAMKHSSYYTQNSRKPAPWLTPGEQGTRLAYEYGHYAHDTIIRDMSEKALREFAEENMDELADLAVADASQTLDRDGNPYKINYYTQPHKIPVEGTSEAQPLKLKGTIEAQWRKI